MMNPSTANEVDNDPTVERQIRRVMMWPLDGFVLLDRDAPFFDVSQYAGHEIGSPVSSTDAIIVFHQAGQYLGVRALRSQALGLRSRRTWLHGTIDGQKADLEPAAD